ncbi:MAG: hypothetical protein OXI73_05690 [Rhodospirillales bacterium]|nr:hypothetical protein [Rhodospirillales bacterium]
MHRAGIELSVSHPWVLMREDTENRAPPEPIKEIRINIVDAEFVGDVQDRRAKLRAELIELWPPRRDKRRAFAASHAGRSASTANSSP